MDIDRVKKKLYSISKSYHAFHMDLEIGHTLTYKLDYRSYSRSECRHNCCM
jgi:hypothetical protein